MFTVPMPLSVHLAFAFDSLIYFIMNKALDGGNSGGGIWGVVLS